MFSRKSRFYQLIAITLLLGNCLFGSALNQSNLFSRTGEHPGPSVLANISRGLFPESSSSRPAINRSRASRGSESYANLPLSFEANRGQSDYQTEFLVRSGGYLVGLSAHEALFSLGRRSVSRGADQSLAASGAGDRNQTIGSVVRMKLVGGNPAAQMRGVDELPGKTNYFIGNDPDKWQANIPNFAKVQCDDVYPEVDMIYYSDHRRLEYDFVVAPGGDPSMIRMAFEGADHISIENGDLVLRAAAGEVRQQRPVVYQEKNGSKEYIEGRYVLTSSREVGFKIAKYDHARALIIDPVLIYSTYFGTAGEEQAFDIAVDSAGSAYITGYSFVRGADVFVAKVNASGTAMSYLTYLGGNTGDEIGYNVAVDAHGFAYVTGYTRSTDYPVLHPLQSSKRGWSNAFVTKLATTGALVYSTYLGGSDQATGHGDFGNGIAVDSESNIYVCGETTNSDFPVASAYQAVRGGLRDSFLTKIRADGSALIFSTFIGGSSTEGGNPIADSNSTSPGRRLAIDPAGNVYVAGYTFSTDLRVVNALQPTKRGEADAYLAKFSITGVPIYVTYLGGTGTGSDFAHGDYAYCVAADKFGNAYLVGNTTSNDFPVVGPIQAHKNGSRDIFITKINPQGTAIVYSTYLGGSNGNETATGIAVDADGNAYVAGVTSATDFPTTNLLQPARGGSDDAFLCKINAAGSALIYSSYVGGGAGDFGSAVAVDEAGNAYLAGWTQSTNFPTTRPFQAANAGQTDAFIMKVDSTVFAVTAAVSDKGGNTGMVSPAIIGGGFQPGATVTLKAANQPDIEGANPFVNDSSNVTATFDLRGAPIGPRDVVVTQTDGRTAKLPNGFTIEEGHASELWADVIGPDTVRQGREQTFDLVVGTHGNIDVPIPLLTLSSPQAVKFTLGDSRILRESPVQILAVAQSGVAAVVPPDTVNHIRVGVVAPPGVGQVTLNVGIVDTGSQSFNWNLFATEGAPVDMGAAEWQSRVALARSRIGESWADVMAAVRMAAASGGADRRSLLVFDDYLRYLVLYFGSGGQLAPQGGAPAAKTIIAAQRQAAAAAASTTQVCAQSAGNIPTQVCVSVEGTFNPQATENIIYWHGRGGTSAGDIIHQLATATRAVKSNANVFIVDWTEGATYTAPGAPPMLPNSSAPLIEPTAKTATQVLHAFGVNPTVTTCVGHSFGRDGCAEYARESAAEGFRLRGLVGLNVASDLSSYRPIDVRPYALHSVDVTADSFTDSRQKNISDYLVNIDSSPTLNAEELHSLGPQLLLRLLNKGDTSLLDVSITFARAPDGFTDGSFVAGDTYNPTPFAIRFTSPLEAVLFGLSKLLKSRNVASVVSRDPNDKFGSQGNGPERSVSGTEQMGYGVIFENQASATAAAQEVIITDQFDLSTLDPNSIALGPIVIGTRPLIPPPASSSFTGTIDLRPANNLIVKVVVGLNKDTGILTWKFTSIDPITGLPTTDPLAGFLPPNLNPPDGEGSVFFAVSPKTGLATGTVVRNQASIIFDDNEAIVTPTWTNAIDNANPTSRVLPLSATQDSTSFAVNFTGSDFGSGIDNFTVFVSQDGKPYTVWLSDVSVTHGTFTGQVGSTYSFYSIARDLTGNLENSKSIAEATTQVVTGADLSLTNVASTDTIVTGSNVTYTITAFNNGPATASPVQLTDQLPQASSLVSCLAGDGQVCGGSGNVRTVSFPALPPNGSATLTIVARLDCLIADGTLLSNVATVNSSNTDPNPNNNSAEAKVSASNPPPAISCPANIVRANDAGLASALVNYPLPVSSDNCSTPVVSCSRASGSTFPIGTTAVTCIATDSAGAQSTCPFTVTVNDNEAPKITQCAANRSLSTNAGSQLALPDLTNEIVASDNFTPPASLTVTQSPPPGTMIGIGNTPVTLTVKDAANNAAACTATINVSRFSLGDFVVLSSEFSQVLAHVKVISGNLGTATSLPDPNGLPDDVEEVVIGEDVQMLGAGSFLVGDTVRLLANSQVQNIIYNELYNLRGNILGGRFSPLSLPMITLPALPPITPGTQDIEVAANQTRTLAPGRYHKITVKDHGVLILTGGVYELSSLDIRQDTRILFNGSAEVRVKNEMDTDARTYIGPHPSATSLKASQIVFYVAGPDDRGRHHDEDDDLTPTAVQIGQRNTAFLNIVAPNGTVWLKSNTKATGSFVGKRVRIGKGAELTLSSAF